MFFQWLFKAYLKDTDTSATPAQNCSPSMPVAECGRNNRYLKSFIIFPLFIVLLNFQIHVWHTQHIITKEMQSEDIYTDNCRPSYWQSSVEKKIPWQTIKITYYVVVFFNIHWWETLVQRAASPKHIPKKLYMLMMKTTSKISHPVTASKTIAWITWRFGGKKQVYRVSLGA